MVPSLRTLQDPSPPVFVGAVSIFALTALSINHIHRNVTNHNLTMIVTLCCGLLGAFIRHLLHADGLLLLGTFRYLVVCVVSATLFNTVMHIWHELSSRTTEEETPLAKEIEEKFGKRDVSREKKPRDLHRDDLIRLPECVSDRYVPHFKILAS